MELIYTKKDYQKIKDYLYKKWPLIADYKIRFKENTYSEYFGKKASILSFNGYDDEIVCSFILENDNKEYEHSFYIFNSAELKKLHLLKD